MTTSMETEITRCRQQNVIQLLNKWYGVCAAFGLGDVTLLLVGIAASCFRDTHSDRQVFFINGMADFEFSKVLT